ncbi:MAG TPA: TspO/MBR family protein [Parachlamydiaceae bacterium]|nr:TspO/MBR family protein [Parachlamydiaceae bacterium]
MDSAISKWGKLVFCLFVCLLIAGLEGMATHESVNGWYKTLIKPSGTPPDYIFPVVWSILYTMIAVSWWLVWIAPTKDKSLALLAFGIQLFLNFLWSWLFFHFESPGLALIDIILLYLSIGFTIYAFWRHSQWAAMLLLPYFVWVGYAMRLNFLIWLNN